MPKIRSFPPIVSRNCEILILGTMPGARSLEKRQYYGHSRNRFWEFMFRVTGHDPTDNYSAKKKMLLENRIALWDVLKHCERRGSLDQNIQNARPNNFRIFFKKYPRIRAVFFNGGKAAHYFKKYAGNIPGKVFTQLPSTSPAAARDPQKKLQRWMHLRRLRNV